MDLAWRIVSSTSDMTLTWYYGKQKTLLVQVKAGYELKEALIDVCTEKSSSTENADCCSVTDQNKTIEAGDNTIIQMYENNIAIRTEPDKPTAKKITTNLNDQFERIGCSCTYTCTQY